MSLEQGFGLTDISPGRLGHVIFMKVQREVTKARENARGEDIRAAYARLSAKDPASLAYRAGGSMTGLITLPHVRSRFSPREITSVLATLYGTADPELLEHEGKLLTDHGTQRTVDVHGHNLSLYTGATTRRQFAHDLIVRKLAEVLRFAGLQVAVEDAGVFQAVHSGSHAAGTIAPGHGYTRWDAGPRGTWIYSF